MAQRKGFAFYSNHPTVQMTDGGDSDQSGQSGRRVGRTPLGSLMDWMGQQAGGGKTEEFKGYSRASGLTAVHDQTDKNT